MQDESNKNEELRNQQNILIYEHDHRPDTSFDRSLLLILHPSPPPTNIEQLFADN